MNRTPSSIAPRKFHFLLLASMACAIAAAGCSSEEDGTTTGGGTGGGTSTGGGTGTGGGTSSSVPSDLSAEGITTWVASGAYKMAPWTAETATPRASSSTTSPHGRVQVYLNDVLATSQAAGNGGFDPSFAPNPPHTQGSAAVKELYDDADQLVGTAFMVKSSASNSGTGWTYYCYGPADRCATGEAESTPAAPIHGEDITVCSGCHGSDSVFTMLP